MNDIYINISNLQSGFFLRKKWPISPLGVSEYYSLLQPNCETINLLNAALIDTKARVKGLH